MCNYIRGDSDSEVGQQGCSKYLRSQKLEAPV